MNPTSTINRRHWHLTPEVTENQLRLDQFLALHCDGLSRTLIRKIIDIGGVHVAGRRVRSCSRPVLHGEAISVYCDGNPLKPFEIRESDILYQDRDFLAINKPAGIETQPTPARYQGTLYSAIVNLLRDPTRPHAEASIGMVQRLDRDTSGVIVFSTSNRAHKRLTEQISTRQVHKIYHALVLGHPPEGEQEIRSLLARCRDNRVRSVEKGGQDAITRYRTVLLLNNASLVEVMPVTGRMHQIRAHMSEAGFPLLGDTRYGGPDIVEGKSVQRHMLHARSLAMTHPVQGSPILIDAPTPLDMQQLTNCLTVEKVKKQETQAC